MMMVLLLNLIPVHKQILNSVQECQRYTTTVFYIATILLCTMASSNYTTIKCTTSFSGSACFAEMLTKTNKQKKNINKKKTGGREHLRSNSITLMSASSAGQLNTQRGSKTRNSLTYRSADLNHLDIKDKVHHLCSSGFSLKAENTI